MRFLDNLLEALNCLRTNKMRSVLTMLGIIIGITAVIAIMTIGTSMSGYMSETMSGFGINNINVSIQSTDNSGPMFGGGGMMFFMGVSQVEDGDKMTDEMLDALREEYPDEIKAYSISESIGSGQTVKGADYANLTLTGVNPEYVVANDLSMTRGRFLIPEDNDARRRLAVVSDRLVSNIFGEEANPLGQELVIQTQDHIDIYTIVGVYEYDSGGMNALFSFITSSDYDIMTDVYIPLSVAQKVLNVRGYSGFSLVTETGVNSTAFSTKVESFLNRYFARNDDYQVSTSSMESMVESVTQMLNMITLAIAGIAAISLLVGGIGVMNIMLVSITERTREIGTRKAIGATNGEIRAQFVIEAVVICLVGGVIGVILGSVLGVGLGTALLDFPTSPSGPSILLSFGVATAIGVFFGYYPANKAAKMDPIDALRYE